MCVWYVCRCLSNFSAQSQHSYALFYARLLCAASMSIIKIEIISVGRTQAHSTLFIFYCAGSIVHNLLHIGARLSARDREKERIAQPDSALARPLMAEAE